MNIRSLPALLAATCTFAITAPSALAQAFPSKPITLVVPFPAGGALDALARPMAEGMRKTLGQPVVVENVAGAGGTVGTGNVARAMPDGYTICWDRSPRTPSRPGSIPSSATTRSPASRRSLN